MPQNPAQGGRDHYPTPLLYAEWAAQRALKLINHRQQDDFCVFEPGSGANAPFINSVMDLHSCKSGLGVEIAGEGTVGKSPVIQHGVDFLKMTDEDLKPYVNLRGKFDVIATNPPFSHAEQFLRRSFELLDPHGVMVYLLRLAIVGSEKRMWIWKEHPPVEIATFIRRISFDGVSTDYSEYACFFWLGEELLEVNQHDHTKFYWVDNTSVKKKDVETKVEAFGVWR